MFESLNLFTAGASQIYVVLASMMKLLCSPCHVNMMESVGLFKYDGDSRSV